MDPTMAAAVKAAGDGQPKEGGEEERWPSLALPPAAQRRMRFYLACAIVDLKFDLWDQIQAHFVLDPSRHDLEEDLAQDPDAGGGSGEQADDGHDQPACSCRHRVPDAASGERSSEAEEDTKEEEEEEYGELWREFTEKNIIASGYDERMKEMDAIEEVYFDAGMDVETSTATIDRLWRHIDRELSDRARAVSTGKFIF